MMSPSLSILDDIGCIFRWLSIYSIVLLLAVFVLWIVCFNLGFPYKIPGLSCLPCTIEYSLHARGIFVTIIVTT